MTTRKYYLPSLAMIVALALASSMAGAATNTPAKAAGTGVVSSTATKQRALTAYGQLSLGFVPNAGQLDRQVRYSAQAGGASFYFTKQEAVFSLAKKNKGLALRLGFIGANRRVQIVGRQPGPGRVNYLIGNDPAGWHTSLPTYGELVYHNLWPGIDLIVRGQKGGLKYEFVLKPGADVRDIRLAYRGVKGLSLDRAGNLRLETPLGTFEDSRPVSYQQLGGRQVPVKSRFVLGPAAGAYRFTVGAYDRSHPLVIDPTFLYSTYLGGSGDDRGEGIVVDVDDDAYVAGYTSSVDFPTTVGAFDTSYNGGGADVFVSKLNASGSALIYSTYVGGSGGDQGFAIAVDSAENTYITGGTSSADFPTTPGAYDTTYNDGGQDVFVTKLNASGSALIYSTYVGGAISGDIGYGIKLDTYSRVYVAGYTQSSNFPITLGAYDTTYNGGGDVIVFKLNPAGNGSQDLVYSTFLGGTQRDTPNGNNTDVMSLTPDRNVFVTGLTYSTDFPTQAGSYDQTFNGNWDAFVTKLNAAGSALIYSTYLGGSLGDRGNGIAIGSGNTAYVTGSTSSANFPTTVGAYDTTHDPAPHDDAFVAKLNTAGGALVYSSFLGGNDLDEGHGIAVDSAGKAYITGLTGSTLGTFPGCLLQGVTDPFVTKLNPVGSGVGDLVYSTCLGGSGGLEQGSDIALEVVPTPTQPTVYVTGYTSSSDFPTTAGAYDTSYNGGEDAFVSRLDVP